MKGQIRFFGLKNFVLIITILFSFISVTANNSAKGVSERTISAIAGNLSKKLKIDLADNSAVVKISDIEKQQSAKNTIDLKGSAYCVLKGENTKLPIQFEAKIDAQTQTVSDVNYSFVEENAEYAPTTTEEVLMKQLMQKVSKDYKTDSIVIAIDGFEILPSGEGKAYEGIGEIKIGEIGWTKINFTVVLDDENKASKIKYEIK